MTTATLSPALDVQADVPHVDPILATVPAPLLWAAAQFASTDETKLQLTTVCIKRYEIKPGDEHAGDDGEHVGPGLTIAATDGHRLFRAVVPCGPSTVWEAVAPTDYDPAGIPDDGWLLDAAKLRKRVPYAQMAHIKQSGDVTFRGGRIKKSTESLPTEFLMTQNCTPWEARHCTFPQVDQLMPSSYGQGQGTPIAFNPRYLKDACAVAEKLSSNTVVKLRRNHAWTPAVWSFLYELWSVGFITVEMLIMPVQIRC